MKMRVRKKINWMKRMVAAGMAVCMVLMTPASALAGGREGTETQTISEEAAGESILDTGTGSVDAGEDGGTGGQTESKANRAGQKPGQTARSHQKRTARQKRLDLQKKTARQKRLDLRNKAARQKKTGSAEKKTQLDSTDSAKSSSQIDDTAALESAEQKPESTSAENEGQNRQDGSDAEKPGKCRIRSGGCGKSDSDADA